MKQLVLLCAFLIVASEGARAQGATQADKSFFDHLLTLDRFEELSIDADAAAGIEVIRVIVWPTFENPVAVRVEAHNEQYHLTAKRLSGQGGYGPGPVDQVKRRQLRRAEWNQLQSLLAKAGFWSMATEDERFAPLLDGSQMICMDGTHWTVEVRDSRGYRTVQRYCPEEGSFTAIGRYLVKLSKLGINEWRL